MYPSSSAIIRSYFSNLFSNVCNFFSLLDSFNSFIKYSTVAKYTLYPLLQASIPSSIDRWVFPFPGLPANIIFLPSSIN